MASISGRRVLERLSRGVVLRRRFPSEYGACRIFVTPDASLRYWKPTLQNIDRSLLNAVRVLVEPGHTVWDVGANVGLFTLPAAWRAGAQGRLLAIEPDAFLAVLLRRSIRANAERIAPSEVLCGAVADSVRMDTFEIASRGRASNSLSGMGRLTAGGVRERQPVLVVTLDWLLNHWPAPQVVKIDVEGAEVKVLDGAATLLQHHRPTLICEIGDDVAEEATRILLAHDYELFDMRSFDGERRLVDVAVPNTVAIPRPGTVEPAGGAGR